jgi:glycine oxidase
VKVAVVGFGVLGAFCSLWAKKFALEVTVFEKSTTPFDNSAASKAGGMLAPFSESHVRDSSLQNLLVEALEAWKNLPWNFVRNQVNYGGTYLVANNKNAHALETYLGYLDHEDIEEVSDLSSIGISNIVEDNLRGVHIKGEGSVNPSKLLSDVFSFLQKSGVNFSFGSDVCKNILNQMSEQFDYVLDCRGLGATDKFPQLRGVKGESMVLNAPQSQSVGELIRLIDERQNIYVVPHGDGKTFVGATEVETSASDAHSVDSLIRLISGANEVLSNLREMSVSKLNVGFRPTLPSGRPSVKISENVISINGLSRHGVLLAPILSKFVIEALDSKNWDEIIKRDLTI